MKRVAFRALAGRYSIVRLAAGAALPAWLAGASGSFLTITRTAGETSVVCADEFVPEEERAERGWALIELVGPFSFSEVGILAAVAQPLAVAGMALFAISTFDTDYLLVRSEMLAQACEALVAAGHRTQPA